MYIANLEHRLRQIGLLGPRELLAALEQLVLHLPLSLFVVDEGEDGEGDEDEEDVAARLGAHGARISPVTTDNIAFIIPGTKTGRHGGAARKNVRELEKRSVIRMSHSIDSYIPRIL